MGHSLVRPDSVNKHYLAKVMNLAEEKHIEATEDIVNAQGIKLVAKGTKISRQLQDKLIVHKLFRPFESCIGIEGGINIKSLLFEAKRLTDAVESIGLIMGAIKGRGASPFEVFAKLPIGRVVQMMLTVTKKTAVNALPHSVMVSILSACLANKLGLSERDQSTVALAGLLHDVGELYIDPNFLIPKEHIQPHEWRHVVLHPHIGEMLISEISEYRPEVALAVSEHHERMDGGGYPRQIGQKQISVPGQILAVVEMISGLLMSPDSPLESVELALKIIPSEHSRPIVSAISEAIRTVRQPSLKQGRMTAEEADERIKILFHHLSVIAETGDKMQELASLRSSKAKELCDQVRQRIHIIKRAFASTGLDSCNQEDMRQNQEMIFEATVATKEIRWRLRDVARNLALRSNDLEAGEASAFRPLIAMLDAQPDKKALIKKTASSADTAGSNVAGAAVVAGRTLLLVDDEPDTLSALVRSLKPQGYHILTAPNASEALALMANHDVGVIMADHQMPGMTGIELLSRVKAMYPLAVRIVLTAHSDMTTVNDAITLGAVYKYLTKPWDHDELCTVLEHAFELIENTSHAAMSHGPH